MRIAFSCSSVKSLTLISSEIPHSFKMFFDVVNPMYRSTAVGLLNMLAFFFGGLSGVVMGALSQKWGVKGFEIGFAVMGGTYAVAAILMMVSFFFTFKKNYVKEG